MGLVRLRLRGKLALFVALPVLVAVLALGISAEVILRQSFTEHTRQQMAHAFERLNFSMQIIESDLKSVARLASREEALIASIELVNRYQDKARYNKELIDEEKKLLAKSALDRVKFSQSSEMAIYDQNDELLAFAGQKASTYSLGYLTFANGKPEHLVRTESERNFRQEAVETSKFRAQKHEAQAAHERDAREPIISYQRLGDSLVVKSHQNLFDSGSQKYLGHLEFAYLVDAGFFSRLSSDMGLEISPAFQSPFAQQVSELSAKVTQSQMHPVEAPEKHIGAMRKTTLTGPVFFLVAIDKGREDELISKQRAQTLVVLTVIAAGLLLGIVHVTDKNLMRPLRQLLQQIMQVKRGDYAQTMPPSTNDELEDFGKAINALAQALLQHETELKQSEGRAIGLANRLEEAQAISQLGSWIYELGNAQMEWSAEIFKLLLLDKQLVAPSLNALLDAVHPEDRLAVDSVYRDALARHYDFNVEYRHALADGKLHWVYARCRFEFDQTEKAVRAIGTIQDITERKLAELAQLEASSLLMTVIDSIPMRVFWKDTQLNYLGCNTSFARDAGMASPSDMVGKNDFQMGWVQQAELYRADDQELMDSNVAKLAFEEPQTTPEGGRMWLRTSKIPLRHTDGSVFGILGIYEDITQRKQAEELLRKLSQVAEQSPESVVITDLNGKIEYVNAAFLGNTGYSRTEVIGQNPNVLKSKLTPSQTYKEMWTALRKGQSWSGELVNVRKDSTTFTDWVLISPLRNDMGEVTHYVAVQEDITEKKRLAFELDEYRQGLEVLVTQRTEELNVARRQAEEANRAKSAFLANMSHEIRTPLGAISGMARLVRKEALSDAQLDRMKKLESAARHLSATINDILDLSKIEAGQLELEEGPVVVQTLVDDIANMLREAVSDKGLTLLVQSGPMPAGLLGDSTRLGQALLNYASNAVKFTERGTVTIVCNAEEETAGEALLRFEVRDSGVGLAPEKLHKLFSPFVQADSSTTRKYGGTGLGLAITKRLVEAMGGSAGAQSELGKGSTFWFTARLKKGAVIESANADELQQDAASLLLASCAGRQILLAEDDGFNQEIGSLLLQEVGLLVDIADDGEVAIRMAAQKSYDLILMDMQMPKVDGLQATRSIRASGTGQSVPIVAMTANAFAEDRTRCLEAGMNDFVTKPIDPGLLYQVLYRQLTKSDG